MEILGPFAILLALCVQIFIIVLAILFVASHKRIAQAQESMATAQIEIAKQLNSLAIELRQISNKK